MNAVLCPQCGTSNPAASKFCAACGISLLQAPRVSQPLQPAPSAPTPGSTGQTVPPPPPPSTQRSAPPTSSAQSGSQGIGLTPLGPGLTLQNGRYVVVRALGSGGMSTVFLAQDTHVNNKLVVIKEMQASYATVTERQEAEAEFRAEAATLAALSHPNIPTISDFFIEANRLFIVQAYIEGRDLQKTSEANAGKPLPEKDVMRSASQVLDALVYLAERDPQIIHRDIKPANIIVDPNKRAWLVDFGVASQKTRAPKAAQTQQQSTPYGTPGYAPPEQFNGQETVLSDLYALGATLHHLLTGRDPRQFINPDQLWVYPPPRQLNPRLSDATARIIVRAVQQDTRKRYKNAQIMKRDVDAIAHPGGFLSTWRSRLIALLVVLVLLLLATIGSYVYTQYQNTLPATGFVSDGSIAFDVQTVGRGGASGTALDAAAWAQIKRQASIEQNNGNTDQAYADYQKATANDPTDAESWIYQANHDALALANTQHTTVYRIAVGSSMSGADVFTGRNILQGVYIAQHQINAAGGINGHPLVLELANDASSAAGALESARKAVALPNLLAMVGYSFSSRTAAALPTLAAAHIPLVSATASNPALNTTAYFFRVCPSDDAQGAQAGLYLRAALAGRQASGVAVFSDPSDKYSGGLASIVQGQLASAGIPSSQYPYTIGSTSVSSFLLTARVLATHPPGYIYFAGYAHEALQLAQALDAAGVPQSVQILTDDAFYNPGEFIAQPGHKQRFHFTAYFFPDEGGLVSNTQARASITTLEQEYTSVYYRPGYPLNRYGSSRVSSDSALAYDALMVVANAITHAGAQPNAQAVQKQLALIGTSLPAIQGASGRIAFAPDGNPRDKALLLMHLDSLGRTHMDRFLTPFT